MNATTQCECPPATQGETRFNAPEVNVYETKNGYVLEAEMPGVNKDGLELLLDGHELTLTGRLAPETVSGRPLLRERRPADYRRVFELDPTIDTARITARMNQGVLFLSLPKSEEVKPRKITVGD